MGRFRGNDRFRLIRRLGSGGMGVVYEVEDTARGMRVALKTLRALEPSSLYRFKREFRALTDLAHPNLVTRHELVSEGDLWFFTMELVEGVDFVRHVRPGPRLEPGRLRPALVQLVRAVDALHGAETLHRDIKPSNVMVTPAGRVVLMDFGIVTDLGGDDSKSTDARILGTPAYMAPEQGSGERTTAAADWYSVGSLLYHALTGRVPFFGGGLAAIMAKLQFDPPAPSALKLPEPVDPELEALCLDLLQRDPDARPGVDAILERLGERVEPRTRRARATRTTSGGSSFVGRAAELRVLAEALDEVRGGRGALVALGGQSGMGKTRLVRHFLTGIQEGSLDDDPPLVLAGRCYHQENVPYKAFDGIVDALSHALLLEPRDALPELLPADAPILSRLFPVLQRVPGVADSPVTTVDIPDAQVLRSRGFLALRELLTRVARRRPLVAFIDDLHWADEDSMELLRELTRPPDPPPALLILAYRAEEVRTNELLRRYLERARPHGGVRSVELGPLSEGEAAALARRLLTMEAGGDRTGPENISAESGGSPLFVGEICRFLHLTASDDEPAADEAVKLDEVIGSRVARLPGDARRLLEAMAVAGEPLPRGVLADALALEPEAVEEAVGLLRAQSLARTVPLGGEARIEVYHDRLREVVAAGLGADARRDTHRLLASALERWERAPVESLARHWEGAGEAHRAGEHAVRAAGEAVAKLAFDRGTRLYRMALEDAAPGSEREQALRVALADCLVNAGRGAEAAEQYLVAARGPDRTRSVDLRRMGGEHLLKNGQFVAGMEVFRELLGELGVSIPRGTAGTILQVLWFRLRLRLRRFRFQERDADQVPPIELKKIDALWGVAAGVAYMNPLLAAALGARMFFTAIRAGDARRIGVAFVSEAMMLHAQGQDRHPLADRLLERGALLIRRRGEPEQLGFLAMVEGMIAVHHFRWAEALPHVLEAEKIFLERCQGASWHLSLTRQYILLSLVNQGRLRQVAERLERYLRDAELRHDRFFHGSLRSRFLIARALQDGRLDVRTEIESALDTWPSGMITLQHYYLLVSRVELLLYEGDPAGAERALVEHDHRRVESSYPLVGTIKAELHFLRARVAVSLAREGVDVERNLRDALRVARRLRRKPFSYLRANGTLIEAAACHVRHQDDRRDQLLLDTEVRYDACQMALHAAAVRRRRGDLLGPGRGWDERAGADRTMREEGVREPERLCAVMAPGLTPWEGAGTRAGAAPSRQEARAG